MCRSDLPPIETPDYVVLAFHAGATRAVTYRYYTHERARRAARVLVDTCGHRVAYVYADPLWVTPGAAVLIWSYPE